MFKEFSELNLFNKIISLICVLLSLCFVRNLIFIYVIIGAIILMTLLIKNYNALLYMIIPIVLSFFVNGYNYTYMMIIIKMLIMIVHIFNILFIISSKERMYLLNALFYSGNKKARSFIFNRRYYKKVKAKNKKNFLTVKEKLEPKIMYSNYINNRIKENTKSELNDIYLINRIRFYNYYKVRKSMLKLSWINLDNTFLLVNVLLFVVIYLYR